MAARFCGRDRGRLREPFPAHALGMDRIGPCLALGYCRLPTQPCEHGDSVMSLWDWRAPRRCRPPASSSTVEAGARKSHTWAFAPRPAEIGSSARISPKFRKSFFGSLGADPSCTTQTLRAFQRASFGRNEYLGRGGARCGSRSWQRVPWEVISAGEWPRLDMMWRSLRA